MSIKQTNSGLEIKKLLKNQLKIAETNFCDRVQQRLDFYQMKIQ